MNRRTFLTFAGTSLALSQARFAAARTTDIDGLVAELMEEHAVPGLSLATIRDGEIGFHNAYGVANVESGAKVDGLTVFEAASLSKPLLGQVVMKLSEDGVIDLDRPLVEYRRPKFECKKPERLELITATHVLSHTSGLPNWPVRDRPVFIRFDAGKRFSYSGMGFVMLQRVVEQITEMPYEKFTQTNFFDPLEMESASFVWRDDYETRLAHGHSPKGKPSRSMTTASNSAASLMCTAEDYAKYVVQLLDPNAAGPMSLKSATLKRMLQPRSEAAPDIAWSLGWGIQETEPHSSYWHWGNNGGSDGPRFMAFVVWNRARRDGVVVMTNSGNGLRLCRDLVPQLVEGPHPAFEWPSVVR